MATIQVALFLLLGAAFFYYTHQERALISHSANLAMRISTFDEAPSILVSELETAYLTAKYFNEFYMENFPTPFNPLWFAVILETLPYGARAIRINYSRQQILFEGEVEDISDIETHRWGILDFEFFTYVRPGRTSLLENGNFNYELRIGVQSNE